MTKAHFKIEHCVEGLCNQGCDRVNSSIEALRAGEEIAEVAELNMEERQQVLETLVSIMAVYNGRSKR